MIHSRVLLPRRENSWSTQPAVQREASKVSFEEAAQGHEERQKAATLVCMISGSSL